MHVKVDMHAPNHQHLPCRDEPAVKLVEIIAAESKPVLLRFSDDSIQQLPVDLDIAQAVTKLREGAGYGMVSSSYVTTARTFTITSSCVSTCRKPMINCLSSEQ